MLNMTEHDVIDAFVSHLGQHKGCPNLAVDRRPDRDNRTEPEIDAVAGRFAIEHTSIDSVMDQRRRDHEFLQVVRGLDQVIQDSVDGGLTVTLEFDAIETGMDWNSIRDDLQKLIEDQVPCLEDGNHEITLPTSTPVEFPIVLHVRKGSSPAIVGFSRFEPEDDTLTARVRSLLDRKATKLKKYQGPSTTTVLLVESDDIALMNELKMLGAVQDAYPDGVPHGVDEIWFADTSITVKPQFHDFTTRIVDKCRRVSLPQ